ncbi:unnamed protein product [Sphagnum jensenii]|uniref:GPI transamidase subunit PIG-U n=1 Tax=Sphagnum jensenii TaxID=128206 RepID=A0ABP0XKC5_9BRYO
MQSVKTGAGFMSTKMVTLWGGLLLSVAIRFLLSAMGSASLLGRRLEVVSPVTSLTRLAEGQWLKQLGLSPYAGSVYHGSPLLLSLLGPFIGNRRDILLIIESERSDLCSFWVFVAADLIGALLLRSMGESLESAHIHHLSLLGLTLEQIPTSDGKAKSQGSGRWGTGNTAALFYLLNPFTIAVCIGGSTSPIENMLTILALYGAIAGIVPLAGFGWAMATHVGMYPAILFIPIACLLANGPDGPPSKLYKSPELVQAVHDRDGKCSSEIGNFQQQPAMHVIKSSNTNVTLSSGAKWLVVLKLIMWSAISWLCILGLCNFSLHEHASLHDMWSETYRFILTVEDLSPNLGVFWYFFTEVFNFFRPFFIMVFHSNIVFMVMPLTIRLHHRPVFLAFTLTAISSMLKSYPSVGDAALYLGLMCLCIHQLSGLQYFYLLLNGYFFTAIIGPVMYNLWIWRGTGNANFYFAMNLVYATLQTVLIVESSSTIIRYDRNLKKQSVKRSRTST